MILKNIFFKRVGAKMYQISQKWGTFNDLDVIREKFPGLIFKDNIGSFRFVYASIYGRDNVDNSVKRFNKNHSNRNISQAIFYFKKTENTICSDNGLGELYIDLSTISCCGDAFCLSIEEYKYIIKSIHFCNIADEPFEVDGDTFYLVYNEDKTKISGILYQKEIDNTLYSCLITTVSHNWIYSVDKITTIDFIRQIDLKTFLYELYSSLDK
jgi:hypothetical protein